MKKKFFEINRQKVLPGEERVVYLETARLFDFTEMKIPIKVIRGEVEGPTLFVSAGIHGNEINGVEIIKRLLQIKELKNIKGNLIAIPVVNVFGFNNQSRYLPDRRDLNRCFPGSKKGSLGSRLASLFMKEIVKKSQFGIDLHTGAIHRTNLPQIRAYIKDSNTKILAKAFGVPVIINSKLRDGSLRQAARDRGLPMLLYEAGEALRFDEGAIQRGLEGVLSVMREIDMLPKEVEEKNSSNQEVFIALSSDWIRAPRSGILSINKCLGNRISEGSLLGYICDPLGVESEEIRSDREGIVIGHVTMPLVNRGDALFHVAQFKQPKRVSRVLKLYDSEFDYEGLGS